MQNLSDSQPPGGRPRVREACQPYVHAREYEPIFAALSREDLESMLVYLSGYDPLAFESALARIRRGQR